MFKLQYTLAISVCSCRMYFVIVYAEGCVYAYTADRLGTRGGIFDYVLIVYLFKSWCWLVVCCFTLTLDKNILLIWSHYHYQWSTAKSVCVVLEQGEVLFLCDTGPRCFRSHPEDRLNSVAFYDKQRTYMYLLTGRFTLKNIF